MDNAGIIDLILGAVLIAGVVAGAKRGLFKSLMGLLVVVLALVGASMLANALTPAITDALAPRVEDAMAERFFYEHEAGISGEASDTGVGQSIADALRELGVPSETLNRLTSSLQSTSEAVKQDIAEIYRSAISASVRTLVSGTANATVFLMLFLVLSILLRMLTRLLDRVFDLPVLSTLNGLGGAAFGLIEAALLLFLVVYVASRFGASWVDERAEDSRLLAFFSNNTPIGLITSLSQ